MSETTFLEALTLMCGTVGFLGSLRFLRGYLELRQQRGVQRAGDGIDQRLARIEAVVESTAIEVERISEAQRFMARLLAERGATPALPARPERVITPH